MFERIGGSVGRVVQLLFIERGRRPQGNSHRAQTFPHAFELLNGDGCERGRRLGQVRFALLEPGDDNLRRIERLTDTQHVDRDAAR